MCDRPFTRTPRLHVTRLSSQQDVRRSPVNEPPLRVRAILSNGKMPRKPGSLTRPYFFSNTLSQHTNYDKARAGRAFFQVGKMPLDGNPPRSLGSNAKLTSQEMPHSINVTIYCPTPRPAPSPS